jgi:hypothetical protein
MRAPIFTPKDPTEKDPKESSNETQNQEPRQTTQHNNNNFHIDFIESCVLKMDENRRGISNITVQTRRDGTTVGEFVKLTMV